MLEEVGCVSQDWQDLGRFSVDPNRGCGNCFAFFADHATRIEDPTQRDTEQVAEFYVTEEELLRILLNGQIKAVTVAVTK